MRTIEEMWQEFEGKCIAPEAPEVQHNEMRLAFYAGFTAMFIAADEIGKPEVSEDEGVQMLVRIQEQLTVFTMSLSGILDG